MPKNQKPPDDDDHEEEIREKLTKKRHSAPGVRHRRDNGPAELEVQPVPPPTPEELGTLTKYGREIIEGGARSMIAAEHKAARLAERLGIEIEAQWCLTTPYLKQLATIDEGKHARNARYAINWRPRYLAVLSLSRSDIMACRAAKISRHTSWHHRKVDPEFDAQCLAAEEHAIELLHDVTMQSAIEGETEPVYWQGIEVGHIRKVDNRLRIEMLRAHMPGKFKTPGSKVAINTGNTQNNQFIFGPEEVQQLIASRQEALKRMQAETLPAVIVEQP
jgi:hypothetical protein